jgi:hypothetical protein
VLQATEAVAREATLLQFEQRCAALFRTGASFRAKAPLNGVSEICGIAGIVASPLGEGDGSFEAHNEH